MSGEGLTSAETAELERYEELDEYRNLPNRVMCNLILEGPQP